MELIKQITYEPAKVTGGYTDRILDVDLSQSQATIRELTPDFKDKYIGGRGYALKLIWDGTGGETRYDSPENILVMASGPLGNEPGFPGTGKFIVGTISPLSDTFVDSNVGGHFGPLLKLAGFDALEIQGKAKEDVLLVIDGKKNRVSLETAPHEAVNSVDLAEQLHRMYADGREELQSVSVVSAGKGAENTLIGCLNFSWWDWDRKVPRLKQAGRGGLGTVFRNKKLKALVAKSLMNRPRWVISVQSP